MASALRRTTDQFRSANPGTHRCKIGGEGKVSGVRRAAYGSLGESR